MKLPKFYQELNKELTESEITLTDLFNMCLRYNNPYSKPWEQVRPSSAINTFRFDKAKRAILNRKIEAQSMKLVLESVGIVVPYDQFERLLNAFHLKRKHQLSYQEFIKVFAETHYPQPFVRSTHLEPTEKSTTPIMDYSSTPKMLSNVATSDLNSAISSASKEYGFTFSSTSIKY